MNGVLWMSPENQKKLVGRLRRVAGQVRALEAAVGRREPEDVTNQLLAVIAGSKASLRFYIEQEILSGETIGQKDRALLARLLEQS